jgi:uncharacterized protein (DUF2461 family)
MWQAVSEVAQTIRQAIESWATTFRFMMIMLAISVAIWAMLMIVA